MKDVQEAAPEDHASDTDVSDSEPINSFDDPSLEEKVLGFMNGEEEKKEVSEDDEVDTGKVSETKVTEDATPAPLFDLNGKLTLKAGTQLSPEHIKELERGWLRESDYTRKTQEIAAVRQDYLRLNNIAQQIEKDPRAIRQHLPTEKILSAFSPEELLNVGLAQAKVPPQLWNEFLDWHAENGGQFSDKSQGFKADPYQEKFSKYEQKISTLEAKILGKEEKESRAAYETQLSNFDKEVDAAVAKYPGLKKKSLLVQIAASDGNKSPDEIAKELADERARDIEQEKQSWLTRKKEQQTNRVTVPKGSRVPIMPKQPKTFEEADAMVEQAYGYGAR